MISRAEWSNLLHNMFASAVSTDWQAATNNFTKSRQIRFNLRMIIEPGIRLCGTVMETESRNHLVIDNQ
ncbi:hypothetical protein D3C74_477000 [compost metagenome]